MTGWPCPNCGCEDWGASHCRHCRIVLSDVWADGCWMGRWWQAGKPGSLAEFVEERSEELRRG